MYGITLAHQHFIRSIESEIRNYWLITTSLIYTRRWWGTIGEADLPIRISEFPGDKRIPFNSIDIPPNEYLEYIANTEKFTRENSIVNFITVLEVYLLAITKRILYINPELIDNSEMPFEAKDIAIAMNTNDFRDWFAEKVTYKYIKNKTHLKMIQKLQQVIKYELYNPMKTIIEEWNKWTYVRNAIIHNGRQVSSDLIKVWPERFTVISENLNLTDRDIIRVHYLAMELCKFIDRIMIEKIVKHEDACLLVREIFVRHGIDDPKELSRRIYRVLNHKLSTPMVDKCLGYQRKTSAAVCGWNFSMYNLEE